MELRKFEHPADVIVETMERIYRHGMTTTSGGNLSVMDPGGDMWISPASVDKGSLVRSDIVCVKADGSREGRYKPSSEYPFHNAVYKIRGDVKAVLHAHPPALVSFSVAGRKPDVSMCPHYKAVCGSVGFAGYDVPGSESLGKKVSAEFAAGHDSVLLCNHGSCCAGATMKEAFRRFESLDFCARTESCAVSLGGVNTLSDAEIDEYNASMGTGLGECRPAGAPSSAELALRRDMARMARRSYEQGLFTCASGTIAARLGEDCFLVSCADYDRGNAEPSDFVVVRGGCAESGTLPDPMALFFREVFAANPDAVSIMVSRPPHLMGYAVSSAVFDPRVIPESYILLREMPALPFGCQYADKDLALSTLSARHPIVIFRNDCIMSVGRTILEAFDRTEVGEYSARATIAANAFGGMKPMGDAEIADLVKAFNLPE